MDKLIIQGGKPLHGEVKISGAKNAALPIMAATLLASKSIILTNIPKLHDVDTMLKLLETLGMKISGFLARSRCSLNGKQTTKGDQG